MPISARQFKLILLGIAIIILAFIFRAWLINRDQNKSNKATVEQAQRTQQASVEIANNSSKAFEDIQQVETVVRTERIYIERQQEVLRDENPEIMDWSNGVIPVKLRDADRAARLTGQRSSNLQSGLETDSSGKNN